MPLTAKIHCQSRHSLSMEAMLPVTYTYGEVESTAWVGSGWVGSTNANDVTDPLLNLTTLPPGYVRSLGVEIAWQVTDLDAFPTD